MLLFLLLLMGLSFQAPASLAADDPFKGPWEWATDNASVRGRHHPAQTTRSGEKTYSPILLRFFQKVISPVDGSRCPSYPTCAAYSKEAYQKHGPLLGTLMTVDRLFHEASEGRFSPTVELHGVERIYDPVSANEFWRRDGKTHSPTDNARQRQ